MLVGNAKERVPAACISVAKKPLYVQPLSIVASAVNWNLLNLEVIPPSTLSPIEAKAPVIPLIFTSALAMLATSNDIAATKVIKNLFIVILQRTIYYSKNACF